MAPIRDASPARSHTATVSVLIAALHIVYRNGSLHLAPYEVFGCQPRNDLTMRPELRKAGEAGMTCLPARGAAPKELTPAAEISAVRRLRPVRFPYGLASGRSLSPMSRPIRLPRRCRDLAETSESLRSKFRRLAICGIYVPSVSVAKIPISKLQIERDGVRAPV